MASRTLYAHFATEHYISTSITRVTGLSSYTSYPTKIKY